MTSIAFFSTDFTREPIVDEMASALTGKTQLVKDVHAFPGHIACDGRSQSEIVVPVFNADGQLIAVFDVDSDQPAAFDEVDQVWLEQILKDTFATPI